MTVSDRLIGLKRGISSPAAISGLQNWSEADNIIVSAVASPTAVPNCQLWLDASQLVGLNDGDPISTWTDESGNGYDATQTLTKRPTYKTGIVNSLPVARFDGSNDYMQILAAGYLASTNNVGGITMFCVANPTVTSAAGVAVDISTNTDGNARMKLMVVATNKWEIDVRRADADANAVLTGPTTLPGTFQVVTARQNYVTRGSSIWFQGGTEVEQVNIGTAGNTSATNSAGAQIGANATTGGAVFHGDIAEVIVYNRTLTDIEKMGVERYLCNKYGLTFVGCPLANGDPVNIWLDSSGNDWGLRQGTQAAKPLYETNVLNAKPVVRFDGTNDVMRTLVYTSAISQPFTYVLVAKRNAEVDTDTYMDGLSGTSVKMYETFTNAPAHTYGIDAGGTARSGGNNTGDLSWHIWAAVWDTTDVLYIDGGAATASGDAGSAGIPGLILGSNNGNAHFIHADVAACLVYSRALSSAELNLLGNYYASKYALTWTAV